MPNVGMFFGLYKNATLFPVGGENTDISAPRQPQVCSHILSATVGQNIDLSNLNPEDQVKLTFRLEDKLPGVVSPYLSISYKFKCMSNNLLCPIGST